MFKLVSDGIFGWVFTKNHKKEIIKLIYISCNSIFIWVNYFIIMKDYLTTIGNLVSLSRILFAKLSSYLR